MFEYMRRSLVSRRMILGQLVAGSVAVLLSTSAVANCPPSLDFSKRRLARDTEVNLCQAYKGQVVLIVNTASRCGFTYQYDGLEALYRQYRDQGFVVLGFPSNDFGAQEPGSETQIQHFCRTTFGVEFPMFEKIRVAEPHADPLFKALAQQANGDYPRWNFHKYLLDRRGQLVGSFSSQIEPAALEQAILPLLAAQ